MRPLVTGVSGHGHDPGDETRGRELGRILRELPAEAVLHCAAYPDVDGPDRGPKGLSR